MKQTVLFLAMLCFGQAVNAQLGGNHVYEFLNLAPSARVTALGGNLITVADDDVNLAFANPALANAGMSQQLSFNHNFHVAGISNGYAAFGQHIDRWKMTFHGGMQYISYGTFDATDEIGNVTGEFKAAEYAFTLGAAQQVYDKVSVGANLKFVTSNFESYNSVGLVGDLGAYYQDTAKLFTMALVLKNIGGQLTTYTPDNRESVPYEMQVGLSKRLRYLPFRVSVIYHNLNRWNVLYDDPNQEENILFIGEGSDVENPAQVWFDNFSRHFIFNGEFLLGKKENFRMRLGYNHLIRKELQVSNFRSLGGFSLGFGIKINRFRLDYGRGFYHLGGGVNHLTISTNFNEFKKGIIK